MATPIGFGPGLGPVWYVGLSGYWAGHYSVTSPLVLVLGVTVKPRPTLFGAAPTHWASTGAGGRLRVLTVLLGFL